jgi:hypothetical protein
MEHIGASLAIRYFVLGTLFIIGLFKIVEADWAGLFMVAQAFGFSLIPTFLKKFYAIHTPHLLQAGVALFMFATIFLGESGGFYDRFWWWDLVWHLLAGVAFGLIAYVILILTYRKQNVIVAPIFTSIFAISFSMCASALWELLEFGIDLVFKTNMQPSAEDTMSDLLIGFIGAIVSALSGYRYLHYRDTLGMNQIIHDGVEKNENAEAL